ncbi:MAG: GDP-mannose 4,6-dehydratase [Candidatus Magasanikbacteria bacterium]
MSKLTNKNIFVTGGTGLVGSHLVEKLFAVNPAKIVCLVRSHDPQSYFYLNNSDKKVVSVFGDLNDKERIFNIITKYEISHIFHIGAQAIVHTALINPYEAIATNVMGTVNILEAARLSPLIQAVVVASSDKAYGKDCVNATEEHALAGDHPYDASKSATDLIAMAYHNTYGLPITVSRFGNIYGPGDLNFNRIIPGAMKAIIKDELLEIRSDGSFERDYVYVKDVVDGYISLAENIDKTKGQAFNFSSGINLSVLGLIAEMEKILNKKLKYTVLNIQKNEIPKQSLNFNKSKNVLGWRPSTDFTQATKETYQWYEKYF